MLDWANRSGIFCFLDNNHFQVQPSRNECLLAVGEKRSVTAGSLDDLREFLSVGNAWYFGHFNYELKNLIYPPGPFSTDPAGFPLYYFFEPRILIKLQDKILNISAEDPDSVFKEILSIVTRPSQAPELEIKPRLTAGSYIEKIKSIKDHILRGDCYEINFCQEFYAENATIDPVRVFLQLASYSPGPFSCLYRVKDSYLICTSPERFLMKQGQHILSQPMKGTIRRERLDAAADEILKKNLQQSAKDRSENVMIVDLVRNDLSRVCTEGSVRVDELFGVYTYPHVHQMISTVSGTLAENTGLVDIIETNFPMGSMTGAPKQRVMELIDAYEEGPRGIFSGSVGYIDPSGDFDFNVVIRSIMYQASAHYLSYKVGSGITFYSDPVLEWEECLLKGAALKTILEGKV